MTASSNRYALAGKRIWVAGHRGMVGSALVRRLAREGCEILTVTRTEVDLRRQAEVEDWMAAARPHAVFLAAATVGGILANDTRPAEFLYDNLAIEMRGSADQRTQAGVQILARVVRDDDDRETRHSGRRSVMHYLDLPHASSSCSVR